MQVDALLVEPSGACGPRLTELLVEAAEARWPGWPRETTRLTHGITACNGPLGQDTGPGQRGWFARVVQEGEIRVGDEIFAEAPDGPPAKKQRKTSSFFSSESSKL